MDTSREILQFLHYNPQSSRDEIAKGIAFESTLLMPLNLETIEAINESRSGKYAGTLDMTDFDSFLHSIDEIK